MSTDNLKFDAYLFDLDGTLCDVRHRRKFVTSKPKNWQAWNAGLVNDPPNKPVCEIFKKLAGIRTSDCYDWKMIIVSGRSDEYKEQTEEWLRKNQLFYDAIYMRKANDSRDDAIVKAEFADEIEKHYNILGVFDDRLKVVRMWQERGIFVFDVGQGASDF